MPLFEWVEDYDTGFPPMDADHREMAAQINRLHELHAHPYSRSEVAALLGKLAATARGHFSREENFMARSAYPRAEAHWLEHDNLCQDLAEVIEEYSHGGYAEIEDALENYLKFWLLSHITSEDFKLADFLLSQEFPHSP